MATQKVQHTDEDGLKLKLVQLYGGAFTCSLPVSFQDVSSLREIPDNQEVYVHSSCDQSIIIELVEFQNIPDQESAEYHFKDLAESNGSTPEEAKVLCVVSLPREQLALCECSAGWLLTGSQMVAKFNKSDKTNVKILLCVLRLPAYTTDMLISFNCPSALGRDNDIEMFSSVIKSFRLLNPSVFV